MGLLQFDFRAHGLLLQIHNLSQRLTRFLVCGASAAGLNVLLMLAIVDGLGWNTPLLRNLA